MAKIVKPEAGPKSQSPKSKPKRLRMTLFSLEVFGEPLWPARGSACYVTLSSGTAKRVLGVQTT